MDRASEVLDDEWPLDRLAATASLLRSRQRGGWTAAQSMELLRHRWLSDAQRVALNVSIGGRRASSNWPQLAKMKRKLGAHVVGYGAQVMLPEHHARFVEALEQLPSITDDSPMILSSALINAAPSDADTHKETM